MNNTQGHPEFNRVSGSCPVPARAYAPKSFQPFPGKRHWDLPQIRGGPQIPFETNLLASLSRARETGEANLWDEQERLHVMLI